ncbi:kinase-like protein [Byssothecium circinans]|uniref:Kinase-like protein n=1 Tax=Byssothecium circinans TaxID=147558 RepID=A0A6A5TRD6_9PLEO|nr:kinase-like protein [Byssothecium circinans]
MEQPGLEWDYDEVFFGPQPTWTVEPDKQVIRQIIKRELAIPDDTECEVAFLAEGSINKVYTIKWADENGMTCIMRVALPVHPHMRTFSEIATIELVRELTEIPLPRVLKYDARFDNELGFEWMIMDLVPGETLEGRWHQVSWEKKEELVCQTVKYIAQLHQRRFKRIGSVYTYENLSSIASDDKPLSVSIEGKKYCLSETVSLPFFLSDHLTHRNLAARLQLYINDSEKVLTDPSIAAEDYDHVAATCVKHAAIKLTALLPRVFPDADDVFVLHNHDLNKQNMLVDAEGNLTGIIDWECIHTSPPWYSCQFPAFLHGPRRSQKPEQSEYMYKDDEDDEEELDELYWQRLEEWEKALLRVRFVEEMRSVFPEWEEIFGKSKVKADFELAMQHLDNELLFERIMGWVGEVQEGREARSLRDIFRGGC